VAYVAGIPSSTGDSTAYFEFKYTTYDPAKQAWQMRSWYDPGFHDLEIVTKDSVVVFLYQASGAYWIWADIYDPMKGTWGFGGAQGFNSPNPFWAVTINNATVNFYTVISGVAVGDTFGYFTGQGWYMGNITPPRAYFVARPTSGPASLWVWFTDMSIGASTWNWNFGDGNSSTSRSPYHHYDNKGTYAASQSINAGASHYESTINVGGAGIAPLLLLLLNN
jgi:PKD repeat protein